MRFYLIEDPMTLRLHRGKHSGKTIRMILDIDPGYIWDDWEGSGQDYIKHIRSQLREQCDNDDLCEHTDETGPVCEVYLDWQRHYGITS